MNETHAQHILEVEGVVMAFGGLMALINLEFEVQQGTIKAIIGPNGAGKTTLFNVLTGTFPPTEGSVRFKGQYIESQKSP